MSVCVSELLFQRGYFVCKNCERHTFDTFNNSRLKRARLKLKWKLPDTHTHAFPRRAAAYYMPRVICGLVYLGETIVEERAGSERNDKTRRVVPVCTALINIT